MGMRSQRILVLAVLVALVASFAVPMTAAAGGSSSGFSSSDEFSETDGGETNEFGETITEETDFSDASADEYPREGIASGGGSTASGGPSPLPLLLSAGAFALLATGSGGFALRRRLGR